MSRRNPCLATPLALDARGRGAGHGDRFRAELAHAERFAQLLEPLQGRSTGRARWVLWLRGRADEVRAFARDVEADWRATRLSDEAATAALGGYLADLHRTRGLLLGEDSVLPCCERGERESTAARPRFAARSRPYLRRVVSRVATDSTPTVPRFALGTVRVPRVARGVA